MKRSILTKTNVWITVSTVAYAVISWLLVRFSSLRILSVYSFFSLPLFFVLSGISCLVLGVTAIAKRQCIIANVFLIIISLAFLVAAVLFVPAVRK